MSSVKEKLKQQMQEQELELEIGRVQIERKAETLISDLKQMLVGLDESGVTSSYPVVGSTGPEIDLLCREYRVRKQMLKGLSRLEAASQEESVSVTQNQEVKP